MRNEGHSQGVRRRGCSPWLICLLLGTLSSVGGVDAADPAATAERVALSEQQEAFFETRIRPVLVTHCYECHAEGAKVVQGGLRLDHRGGLLQGGDSGPALVPGNVEQSLLLKALRYETLEMPPQGKLPEAVIQDFAAWIAMGAPDPRQLATTRPSRQIDWEEGRQHWAFQPVVNPPLPAVNERNWPLQELDHFVLAKLETVDLQPSPDADRYTWLRRVRLDLTGLPATRSEVEAFLQDDSPQAYEVVVDRLLSTREYGERWARHWLDLTGYADMMGTSNNVFAEHAWRYRDYLIAAFQQDKPYDRFVREQLAGDLLSASTPQERAEYLTATGFLMVGDVEIVEPDKAKMEADHIDTQVSKIGMVFLGMTLGCVRCHDHKFDPIDLSDYYGLAGILRSSPSTHKIPFGVWSMLNSTELPETPEQLAARQQREAERAALLAEIKAEQTRREEEKKAVIAELTELERALSQHDMVSGPKAAQEKGDAEGEGAREGKVKGKGKRKGKNKDKDKGKHQDKEKEENEIKPEQELVQESLNNLEKTPEAARPENEELQQRKEKLVARRAELEGQLQSLAARIQHAEFFRSLVPKAFAMRDGDQPADMPIYIRGNPYATGRVIPRGAVRVISWEKFPEIPAGQSGRLQLADWIADRRNPLTARVLVNRVWQKLFGEGLVTSVDYFGTRGETPSHPELLDHLATRFMDEGWSVKQLIRSLVLSRTYRQSGFNREAGLQIDPNNRLLWRMNRQRLDAEAIRDSLLAVSGRLMVSQGGPALVLEEVENCGALVQQGVNPPNYTHRKPRPAQAYQRTIYLPVMRTNTISEDRIRTHFDFINPAQIAGQRAQTVVPTQALFVMNNELFRQHAKSLADSLIAEFSSHERRLEQLWLQVLNRPISAEERAEVAAFFRGWEVERRSQADEQDGDAKLGQQSARPKAATPGASGSAVAGASIAAPKVTASDASAPSVSASSLSEPAAAGLAATSPAAAAASDSTDMLPAEAWHELCHSLLASNEFLFRF